MRSRKLYPLWRLLFIAAVAGIWELLALGHVFNSVALATPVSVAKIMWKWVAHGSVAPANGTIWTSIAATMFVFIVGYFTGVAAGVALGALLGASKWVRAYLSPFIVFLNATPRLILVPFLAAWLGFSALPKIIVVFIVISIIVTITVQASISEVGLDYRNNALMLGASRLDLVRDVFLPGIVVYVLSSARLAVGVAFQAAVISEFLFGGTSGLGYLINQGQEWLNTPMIYGAIIITSLLAWVIDFLMSIVQRRVTKWHPSSAR